MKYFIVFLFLSFTHSAYSQAPDVESFEKDPYYEIEDKALIDDGKCGTGRTSDIVPDMPFGYNFTRSCAIHDRCYDTCGQPKNNCDSNFRKNMNRYCRSRFGVWDAKRYTCLGVAQTYWEAVHSLGREAYSDAQEDACR